MSKIIYKIAAQYQKLLKTAQEANASNQEFNSVVDNMTQPFVNDIMNKAINDPNAPKDNIEFSWSFNISYSQSGFIVKPNITEANTPQVQKWALGVLSKNNAAYIVKLNETLKTYNANPQKSAEVKPLYNFVVSGGYKA